MAEQQLRKAQEELRLAEMKCQALRPLLKRQEIPSLQMEEAEAARQQAEAAVGEAAAIFTVRGRPRKKSPKPRRTWRWRKPRATSLRWNGTCAQ